MKVYGSITRLVDLIYRKSGFAVTVQPSTASADTVFQWPAAAGGTHAITTSDNTATFTNKTYDATGTGNVLSNVANSNISASAAIAYSKLAALTASKALQSDGSGFVSASAVTSTELGYVSGVTSAIQTQIDSKLSKSGGTMTGNIDMGGFKLTNLAAGTASGNSVRYEQVVLTNGTNPVTGDLSFSGTAKITNLVDPLAAQDGATKSYVDNAIAGLSWKEAARVASIANVTVSSAPAAIDGVTLTSGDRVLLKDQTTGSQNGIYQFNGTASALTRTTDFDSWSEVVGGVVYVEEGTVNAGSKWVDTNVTGGTLGTTAITFTTFAATSSLDGVGTAGYNAYWTAAHTLAAEQYVAAVRGGLATDATGFTGLVKASGGVFSASALVNADVAAGAAIAYSKLAALTASRALVSDGSGVVSVSTTTSTEIGYIAGLTSAVQTQLNGMLQLAGRAGGQIANGGVAAGEELILRSTAHANKGAVRLTGSSGDYLALDDNSTGANAFLTRPDYVTPQQMLQIATSHPAAFVGYAGDFSDSDGCEIDVFASQGDFGTPAPMTAGQGLFSIYTLNYDGANFKTAAYMRAYATENQSTTANGSAWDFGTTTRGLIGPTNRKSRLNISSDGVVVNNATFGVGAVSAAAVDVNLSTGDAYWGLEGRGLRIRGAFYNDTTSSGTVSQIVVHGIDRPTISATSATTYTNAASVYINGAPTTGTNVSYTTTWALWVGVADTNGKVRFDGDLHVNANSYVNNGNKLYVRSTSNTHYSSFKESASATADADYVLPLAPPASSGYVLSSDTSGNMSWVSNAATSSFSDTWTSGTTKTVTHSLGTKKVNVVLYEIDSPFEEVMVDTIAHTSTSAIDLTASEAPTGSGWQIVVTVVG